MGHGHGTTASVDLEFAKDITIGRGGLGDEDADVSPAGRLRQLEVVHRAARRRQRLQGAPIPGVVGNLNGAFGGAADPVENHSVEGAGGAQIDVHPFGSVARRLPGGGEVERAAHLDARVVVEECQLAHAPLRARAALIRHAVEARVRGGG